MSGAWLAEGVLAIHLAVIAFNIFGLIVIPLGAWRRWRFVRAPPWRWLHVASLGVVAVQALAGRACFLTLWQSALLGSRAREPLIMRTVNSVIFWPLPAWVFVVIYVAAFAWTLALLWIVPPDPWRRR
ncbi:MAG: DUF2784 domain-containing protein [Caulobacteraceae bacterium]